MQRSQVDLGRPRGPVLSAVLCLETQRGLSPLHLLSEDRGGGHTPPGVTPLLGAGLPDCPPLHPHPNVACTPHLSSDLPPDSSGTRAPAWTRCQSPGPSPRCARDSGSYSHSAQDSLHPSARLWTKAAAPAFFSWEARGGTRPGSVPALLGVPSKAFGRCCVAGMAEPGTLEAPGSAPESGGRDPPGACCHSVSEPKRPGKGDSGAGFPKLPQTGGLAHLGLPRGRRADLSPRADVSDPLSVCSHPDTCFWGTR